MVKTSTLHAKTCSRSKKIFLILLSFLVCLNGLCEEDNKESKAIHPQIGTSSAASDGSIKLTLIDQYQNFDGSSQTYEPEICSPKSVNITPDEKKFYVNSLESATTVVFDFKSRKRIKVIKHVFKEGRDDALWAPASGLFTWRHYTDTHKNTFYGKPVESTFSHNGKYLWIPYYKRSFDINAQDPSAVAIIDTQADSIIRLMETGPLPKMICTSPDGKRIAISHWGNNTVGIINIASDSPTDWHYERLLVVDKELKLNFPLDHAVNRDNGSGYCLRGTAFTPDGKWLLVGCMGGGGGIAVIDMQNGKYVGRLIGMSSNVRHILIHKDWLYLSANIPGLIQRIKVSTLESYAEQLSKSNASTLSCEGWETAKVGSGARTIVISPDGRFVFAACNNESKIYVVDTHTMQPTCTIDVDSYPVGMDISHDGHVLLVTSQGHEGIISGNCVDVFQIDYAEEPQIESLAIEETCATDTIFSTESKSSLKETVTQFITSYTKLLIGITSLIAITILIIILMRHKN